MELNKDYRIVEDKKFDTMPVEMLLHPYGGVKFRFTSVKIEENKNLGEAKIKFTYELLEMGDHTETSLRKDKVFNEYAGLILNAIILEVTQADEFGTDDIEEPFDQSGIYEEGSTIHKG